MTPLPGAVENPGLSSGYGIDTEGGGGGGGGGGNGDEGTGGGGGRSGTDGTEGLPDASNNVLSGLGGR